MIFNFSFKIKMDGVLDFYLYHIDRPKKNYTEEIYPYRNIYQEIEESITKLEERLKIIEEKIKKNH